MFRSRREVITCFLAICGLASAMVVLSSCKQKVVSGLSPFEPADQGAVFYVEDVQNIEIADFDGVIASDGQEAAMIAGVFSLAVAQSAPTGLALGKSVDISPRVLPMEGALPSKPVLDVDESASKLRAGDDITAAPRKAAADGIQAGRAMEGLGSAAAPKVRFGEELPGPTLPAPKKQGTSFGDNPKADVDTDIKRNLLDMNTYVPLSEVLTISKRGFLRKTRVHKIIDGTEKKLNVMVWKRGYEPGDPKTGLYVGSETDVIVIPHATGSGRRATQQAAEIHATLVYHSLQPVATRRVVGIEYDVYVRESLLDRGALARKNMLRDDVARQNELTEYRRNNFMHITDKAEFSGEAKKIADEQKALPATQANSSAILPPPGAVDKQQRIEDANRLWNQSYPN